MRPENEEDLNNYKGEYYDNQREKYQDPVTGAHFRYREVYNKLKAIQQKQTHVCSENNLQALKPNRLKEVKSWNVYRHLFKSQDSITNAGDPMKKLSSLSNVKLPSNVLSNHKPQKLRLLNGSKQSKKPATSQSKHEWEELKVKHVRPSFMYFRQ